MSARNRPMRIYRPAVTLCAVCGKPVRHPEPYLMEGDVVRHAVNCTAPLMRRKRLGG